MYYYISLAYVRKWYLYKKHQKHVCVCVCVQERETERAM